MRNGRLVLYTDVEEITFENVIEVLQDAIPDHRFNARDIQFLLNYDSGIQPLQREKKTRTDIDTHCVDNVANEVTEFNLGFKWGNTITLVQNGDGKDTSICEAITELNKNYEMAHIKTKTQELGRFVEVCGVGNVLVDTNTEWEEGKPYFTLDVLDPRTSFVVRSSYYTDHRPMMGVTFRRSKKTGNTYYTCFTKDYRFEILNLQEITNGTTQVKESWMHDKRSGELNPLGIVPIVEYIRSYDRTGCFERQISEMDNLNLLVSDFTNDVDQNTQAIWHGNDVEFPKEVITNSDGSTTEKIKKPSTNEWVMTYTSPDGKQPFINPLAVSYDYSGMLNNIITRRQLILQKCNVPQRNDNSGGSTGIAMSDATGWSQAETSASKQQMITDSCKLEEIEVVLSAINESPYVEQDNVLRKLHVSDVEPNIKRQKTYEMTTKANTIATLLSHGIRGDYVLNAVSFFDDPNEVWVGSRDLIEAYQNSVFGEKEEETEEETIDETSEEVSNDAVGGLDEEEPNADRIMQDQSDQVENSPMIDTNRVD